MSTKIGSVEVEVPVMNAACSVAKTVDDVTALAVTPIGVVTVGSITVLPRDGNPEPRWHTGDGYAINSFGMPNEGLEKYRELLPNMLEIVHGTGKKLSLSVAGFNTDEYVRLAKLADEAKVDLLELNLGCPNVSIDGKQKPIASFDRDYMGEIIESVSEVTQIPLLIKLSPYSNPAELQAVAALLAESGKIAAVVSSNTFANGYLESDGSPVVAMEYGGISGKALLPIALGQVRQFRKALPESIAVIGAGGVETKADVEQYIAAGATAVQSATLIVRDGHSAIGALV